MLNSDLIQEAGKLASAEILALLDNQDQLRSKGNPDVQVSASAVVFKGDKLFFIEHPYQKEILLPAGHVEIGEMPLETAIREFHEETGLTAKAGHLVAVHLIQIPENPLKNEASHQHIDFRYLLTLGDEVAEIAELPVFLLPEEEAPKEFQPYFKLRNEKK